MSQEENFPIPPFSLKALSSSFFNTYLIFSCGSCFINICFLESWLDKRSCSFFFFPIIGVKLIPSFTPKKLTEGVL